jgi:hypothetical protein
MEHKKSIMLKNGYQKRKGEKEYMGWGEENEQK